MWKDIPIPPEFYSEGQEAPFARCLDCDRYLLDERTPYLIEKAVRQLAPYGSRDVVFEYALCLSCYQRVYQTLSEVSRQRMDAYFAQHADFSDRRGLLRDGAGVAQWIDRCIVTSTPRDDLEEYQIVALCQGHRLILTSELPCLVGGGALDEMIALLSNETLDELGRFKDRCSDLPPGLKKVLGPEVFLL